MTTSTNHKFMVYFTNTADPSKVKCKLCNRNLKAKRPFNLKQHLVLLHQLEFRPAKRQKKPRFFHSKQIPTFKIDEHASLENKNADERGNFYDINAGTMASIDSFSRDSCSIATSTTCIPLPPLVRIKQEFSRETIRPDALQDHATIFEVNNIDNENLYNNAETTLLQSHSNKPENFAEPSGTPLRNIRGFSDPIPVTADNDYNPRYKTKITHVADDPLDENTSSSKIDHFEQWTNKKKQLLEIEVLEMRNYKMKLELWEKEQQLHVHCSKFTKDIQSTEQ